MGIRTDARAAAVALVEAYKASAHIRLTMYPARPSSLAPSHAWVDGLAETLAYPAGVLSQRTVRVTIVLVHGLFDSKEAVDNADAFVDGFVPWVEGNPHAAGGNTVCGLIDIEDDPTFVPEWLKPELQRTHFATRLVLEVYAGT